MSGIFHDLRFAARLLRSAPLSSLVIVGVLGLGVGGSVAMYGAVDRLLLRELPFTQPAQLVALYDVDANGTRGPASLLDLDDWRAATTSTEVLAGYRLRSFLLATPEAGGAELVAQVAMTTHGLIEALGVVPVAGRTFTRREERTEEHAIVLGHATAVRLLGSAHGAVGRVVRLNDVGYQVVGVLPASFEFWISDRVPEAYIPLSRADYGTSRNVRSLEVLARLRPAATAHAVGSELGLVAERLAREFPDTNAGRSVAVVPLHEALRGGNRAALTLLSLAAGLLLLGACANAGSLLLERQLSRARQLGLRLALGASPVRLARQSLAEAVLLSAGSLVVGIGVATSMLRWLPWALEVLGGVPAAMAMESARPRLDATAILVAAGLALATAVAMALVSILMGRCVDPAELIRSARAGAGRTGATSRGLVVAQVAASVVLLLGTGVLLRSFLELVGTDPGFRTAGIARFGLGIPAARYRQETDQIDFQRRLAGRLAEVLGVRAAGLTAALPLGGRTFRTSLDLVGRPLAPEQRRRVAINVVSPGYFEALEVALLEGRGFEWSDGPGAPRVALINRALAASLGNDARIGDLVQLGWSSQINPPDARWQVIGIVADMREALEAPAIPTVFLSAGQYPIDGGTWVLRTEGRPEALQPALARAVADIDPALQQVVVGSLQERRWSSLAADRSALALASAFGAVVLALTLLGIYGIAAMEAAERRYELAVRRALGARRADLAVLVLRRGLWTTASGAGLGLLGYGFAGPLLKSRLHGVSVLDPLVAMSVAMLLAAATLVASWRPAALASRVAPSEILDRE